jgi:hypothetical protein
MSGPFDCDWCGREHSADEAYWNGGYCLRCGSFQEQERQPDEREPEPPPEYWLSLRADYATPVLVEFMGSGVKLAVDDPDLIELVDDNGQRFAIDLAEDVGAPKGWGRGSPNWSLVHALARWVMLDTKNNITPFGPWPSTGNPWGFGEEKMRRIRDMARQICMPVWPEVEP